MSNMLLYALEKKEFAHVKKKCWKQLKKDETMKRYQHNEQEKKTLFWENKLFRRHTKYNIFSQKHLKFTLFLQNRKKRYEAKPNRTMPLRGSIKKRHVSSYWRIECKVTIEVTRLQVSMSPSFDEKTRLLEESVRVCTNNQHMHLCLWPYHACFIPE